MYNQKYWGSHLRGVFIPTCYYPTHIFSFMCTTVRPCWTLSHRTEPTQSNTKHSVDYNHALTPMSCDVPMHKRDAMRHCMLYHTTCIRNATWAHNSIPLTRCHGQSHHLHMTSIHHFIHVNISCTHISTSTYNINIQHVILYSSNDTHTIKPCNVHLHIEIHHMSIR